MYRFRQAIREYVYMSNTGVKIAKRKEYQEFIENAGFFLIFDTNQMLDFVYDHPMTILKMVLFAFLHHFIVTLAVQSTVPGNSNVFPLTLLIFMNHTFGKATFAIVLMYKMFKDPVKTSVMGSCLGMWTVVMVNQTEVDWITFLALVPFIFVSLLFTVLRFNPIFVKRSKVLKKTDLSNEDNDEDNEKNDKDSVKSEDESKEPTLSNAYDNEKFEAKNEGPKVKEPTELLISGFGCIDCQLCRFVKGGLCNAILSYFSKTNREGHVEKRLINIQHIAMEDVDVHWLHVKSLVHPNLENGTLKSFQMVNNRAFTDDDALQLGTLLEQNKSLEKLSIVFDYNKTHTEKLYYFLLWDNCLPRFTTTGVHTIIKSLLKIKDVSVNLVDFYGVKLDDKTVQSAKILHKRKGVKVFGCKSDETPKTMLTTLNSWLVKLPCCLLVVGMSTCLAISCVTWY